MNGSPELLEFYLVEATEYLDALDQLVTGTGGAPDGNAFIATARALRGASSMAKVDEVGDIAGPNIIAPNWPLAKTSYGVGR